MPLLSLQQRFVASLFGEPSDIAAAIRAGAGLTAEQRLAIYRHNLREGFHKTLGLEFPVIAALCGPGFFRELAREFQQVHPSASGDLHDVGAPFPEYLRNRFGGGEHDYFADVASLEWAREESARAAESGSLDLEALRAVPAGHLPALRFAIHPAVRLVASPWPILTIWLAHQGSGEVAHVDLGAGPEYVLVRRGRAGPELERVAATGYRALEAMLRGETLGEALDAALAADPVFEMAAALQHFVGRRVLAGLAHQAYAAIGSGEGRAIAYPWM